LPEQSKPPNGIKGEAWQRFVTKSWMEDGELVVQIIPQEQIYKREWVGLTDRGETQNLVRNAKHHGLVFIPRNRRSH
jgi:phenolic acid decarboxylase